MRADDLCPVCGQPYDDHTVRDYRDHLGTHMHESDAPFAEHGERLTEVTSLCDAVDVMAAVFSVPEGAQLAGLPSVMPGLHFKFRQGASVQHDVQLVLSDDGIRALRLLFSSAIDGALKHARRRR